jgi:hypothetical protein
VPSGSLESAVWLSVEIRVKDVADSIVSLLLCSVKFIHLSLPMFPVELNDVYKTTRFTEEYWPFEDNFNLHEHVEEASGGMAKVSSYFGESTEMYQQ